MLYIFLNKFENKREFQKMDASLQTDTPMGVTKWLGDKV
jgi:hypothetical protein